MRWRGYVGLCFCSLIPFLMGSGMLFCAFKIIRHPESGGGRVWGVPGHLRTWVENVPMIATFLTGTVALYSLSALIAGVVTPLRRATGRLGIAVPFLFAAFLLVFAMTHILDPAAVKAWWPGRGGGRSLDSSPNPYVRYIWAAILLVVSGFMLRFGFRQIRESSWRICGRGRRELMHEGFVAGPFNGTGNGDVEVSIRPRTDKMRTVADVTLEMTDGERITGELAAAPEEIETEPLTLRFKREGPWSMHIRAQVKSAEPPMPSYGMVKIKVRCERADPRRG